MKTLTQNELKNLLLATNGSTFVNIVTHTVPVLVGGKKNIYTGLTKVSSVNGIINFRYENSVNNQRDREGLETNFVAQERKWGKHLSQSVIEHNDAYYLQIKVEKTQEPEYFLKGSRVDNTEVNKNLPKRKDGTQEVDKTVILRDYNLSNIREIRLNKQEYKVVV